jgi:hypothetical protein
MCKERTAIDAKNRPVSALVLQKLRTRRFRAVEKMQHGSAG